MPGQVPRTERTRGTATRSIERARQRNPQAFSRWTSQEEQRLREEHREGLPIEEIARRHDRSPPAVEMRLERLGLRGPQDG